MPYKDREAKNAYFRKWAKENRGKIREYRNRNRANLTQSITEYKVTRGCQQCGERHPACLTLHHRDPESKEFNISGYKLTGAGTERVWQEVAKCDVLCFNCHHKLHYEERIAERRSANLDSCT